MRSRSLLRALVSAVACTRTHSEGSHSEGASEAAAPSAPAPPAAPAGGGGAIASPVGGGPSISARRSDVETDHQMHPIQCDMSLA